MAGENKGSTGCYGSSYTCYPFVWLIMKYFVVYVDSHDLLAGGFSFRSNENV